MELIEGNTIGVVGGGPAGSLTAYYVLNLSQRLGISVDVDIYEPKQFTMPGARGCNRCGGVISETLIQMLAVEGILLPAEVIMSTIDAYTLHTESGHVRIQTPLQEMRIATVFRGGGPRISPSSAPSHNNSIGFDHFLLKRACEVGARHIPEQVVRVNWDGDRPQVIAKRTSGT